MKKRWMQIVCSALILAASIGFCAQGISGQNLPADELHRRVYDVYHNLGRWLSDKTEEHVEATYGGLGRTRAVEGVPLSEVVYALVLIKEHLREYIRAVGLTFPPTPHRTIRERLEIPAARRTVRICFAGTTSYDMSGVACANEPTQR